MQEQSCWNTVIDSLVLNLIPHIVSDFLLTGLRLRKSFHQIYSQALKYIILIFHA